MACLVIITHLSSLGFSTGQLVVLESTDFDLNGPDADADVWDCHARTAEKRAFGVVVKKKGSDCRQMWQSH